MRIDFMKKGSNGEYSDVGIQRHYFDNYDLFPEVRVDAIRVVSECDEALLIFEGVEEEGLTILPAERDLVSGDFFTPEGYRIVRHLSTPEPIDEV
jgi:hypothetical protein